MLLSGGIDSSASVALLKEEDNEVVGFFADYGQLTADREWDTVRKICEKLDIEYIRFVVPLETITKSSLLGNGEDPFVPGRNAILIALAVSHAFSIGYSHVAMGARDESGFSDQSYKFMSELNSIMKSNYGIAVFSPIIFQNKDWVVKQAERLGVLDLTYSCWYDPDKPCGKCKKCEDRIKLLGHL